ncbi:MAG: hypothetical protein ACJAU6_001014 [Alphaproteobacteria bacterium]|jgi:hypothetical protein
MTRDLMQKLVSRWHHVELEDTAADRLVTLVNLHAETFNEYAKNSFFDTEPSNFDRMLVVESGDD